MSNSENIEKCAETLLNCPVCLEPFDLTVSDRHPKTLPECRHTFCLPCLRRCCAAATGGSSRMPHSFPCPTCRQPCVVPVGGRGLEDLPTDFRVAQVRELVEQLRKAGPQLRRSDQGGPQCSICQFSNRVTNPPAAEVHCSTCGKDFCARCADRHSETVLFRSHVTKRIKPPTPPPEEEFDDDTLEEQGASGTSWMCQAHHERYLYYCAQCQQPVCTVCVVSGQHDQHPVTSRDDSADPMAAILTARLQEINAKVVKVETSKKATNELRRRQLAMYHEARDDIKRTVDSAHQMIDSMSKELFDDLARLYETDEKKVNDINQKYDDIESEVGALRQTVNDALDLAQQQPTARVKAWFRKLAELIKTSSTACTSLEVPLLPDSAYTGVVAVPDVSVRIGNVERQKLSPTETNTNQQRQLPVGTVQGNSRLTTTATTSAAADVRNAETGRHTTTTYTSAASVSVTKLSAEQPASQPISSIATVNESMRPFVDDASDYSEENEDLSVPAIDRRPIWKSTAFSGSGRGVCFLENGEIAVADCPDSANSWKSVGTGSGAERIKVFDHKGNIIKRLTGSMVTEPWALAYDPTTPNGGSLVVTDRASTSIKILKPTLSTRDLQLWRPAGVIKPNAIAVLKTSPTTMKATATTTSGTFIPSTPSMYILTDGARGSSSRISLHAPVAGRIIKVRSFDLTSGGSAQRQPDTTGWGVGELNFATVDHQDRILVSDSEIGTVTAYDVEGRRLMSFSFDGKCETASAGVEPTASVDDNSTPSRMVPQGIAVDADNNVLVADQSAGISDNTSGQQYVGRVLKFSPDGQFIDVVRRWTTEDGGSKPWGLAYRSESRTLAVATDTCLRVYRI